MTVCGIDFGTSNSTVAVWRDGAPALVPLEGNRTTLPSAMFYPAEGEPPLYGRAAIEAYELHEPGRLLRSLKSILGSALMDERTSAGGRMLRFDAILTGFLQHMKARAEAFAGGPIERVVLGRPVHFVDRDPSADARAEAKLGDIARAAGFRDIAFQFEPVAAALTFEHGLKHDALVFIADIGGGTSDFTVIEAGPGHHPARVLANGGTRVGGTDLDMRLSMTAVMPHLGSGAKTVAGHDLPRWPFFDLATWYRIPLLGKPKVTAMLKAILADCAERGVFARYVDAVKQQAGHRIAGRVEAAKIALSGAERAPIDLAGPDPGPRDGIIAKAGKKAFEGAIEDELEKLRAAMARTLTAGGRRAEDVGILYLTGGSAAVPAVRKLLSEALPKAEVVEGDLFTSVGFGLAIEAGRRFGP